MLNKLPNELEAELESYGELDEILAYQKIMNALQEEAIAKARQPRK